MKTSTLTRCLRKVRPNEFTGCWEFQGAKNNAGYSMITHDVGQVQLAHRVTYTAFRGPIPPGFHVDHTCRIPACINPWHLRAVTVQENHASQTRPTHCPQSHAYTTENTVVEKAGGRKCRTCLNTRARTKWKLRGPVYNATRRLRRVANAA